MDRTGPRGEGPRTGRQMGRCAAPGKKEKNEKETHDQTDKDPTDQTGKDVLTGENERFETDGWVPFGGRGFGRGAGRGLGRATGRGTGRGMGRGIGRNRRRKRGN